MQAQPHNWVPTRHCRTGAVAWVISLCVVLGLPASTLAASPACETATLTVLSPQPTSQDLLAAVFATRGQDRMLLVAGRSGAVFLSRDDGQTFVAAALPDTVQGRDWVDAFAPAPGVLVIVAADGTNVRSDDLGVTWRSLPRPSGIEGPTTWLDAETAFIAPAGMHTARTVDGGKTWESLANDQPVGVDAAAAFADAQRGAAVGRSGLATTQDGGRSWQTVNLSGDVVDQLYAVAFDTAGDHGVASGAGVLYHTRDRGRTWRAESLDERAPIVALSLPDTDTIYALVDNGALWRSFDQATTFDVVELPEGDVTDVAFADRRTGVVTGAAGTVLLTHDAGATWTQLRQGTGRTVLAVAALGKDPATAPLLAVGLGGVHLSTRDGRHWSLGAQHELPSLFDVAFDGSEVVAVTPRGVARAIAGNELAWSMPAGGLSGDIFSRVVARAPGEFYVTAAHALHRLGPGGEPAPVRLPGDPAVLGVAAWSGTLFASTAVGVFFSADGMHFEPLGPVGIVATELVPVAGDAVVARIQGGVLVTLRQSGARLEGLPHGLPLLSARLDERGRAWVGAGFGLVLRADPGGEIAVAPLGAAIEDAVVALDVTHAGVALALTSTGRLFVSRDDGATWQVVVDTAWAGERTTGLGSIDARTHGVGTVVWAGETVFLAGPGGQARKVAPNLTSSEALTVGVGADLAAAAWVNGTLFLGGAGRTVVATTDGGRTWLSSADDLAPERVTGMRFEALQRGLLVTDSGRVLRIGATEDGIYEVLDREPPPIADLRDDGQGTLWVANGDGELVVSANAGETWDLSELTPLSGPVRAFDVSADRVVAVSDGELRVATRDEDVWLWQLQTDALPPVTGLFGSDGHPSALVLTGVGHALLLDGSEEPVCWSVASLPTARDAVAWQNGWVLVGDGGLIGFLAGESAGGTP